jgi:hypothetical protein
LALTLAGWSAFGTEQPSPAVPQAMNPIDAAALGSPELTPSQRPVTGGDEAFPDPFASGVDSKGRVGPATNGIAPTQAFRRANVAGHPIVRVREGERMAVRTSRGGTILERLGARNRFGSPTTLAVLGRHAGWLQVSSTARTDNRPAWVKDDPARLIYGSTEYSISTDLSERTMTLRRDGKLVRRFEVSIGAPGSPTPPGRYGITDIWTTNLNPAYGCCAIALSGHQPQLPPEWTGGDLLGIHGTPTDETGTESSYGCLRATADDMRALVSTVPLGTPVIIRR